MNNNHNSHALTPMLSADQEAAVRATRMSLVDLAEAPAEMLKDFYTEEGLSARQKILVHSAIKIYKESLNSINSASASLSFRSTLPDTSPCSAPSFQTGKFEFNPRHPSLPSTHSDPRSLPSTHTDPRSLPSTHSDPRSLSSIHSDPRSLPSIHSDPRSLPSIHSDTRHFLPAHQFQRPPELNSYTHSPPELNSYTRSPPELNSYTHSSCSLSQAHGAHIPPSALPFAQSSVSLPVSQGCASFEPTQTSAPATFVPLASLPSPVLLTSLPSPILLTSPKAPPLEPTVQTPIFPTHLKLPPTSEFLTQASNVSQIELPLSGLESMQAPDPSIVQGPSLVQEAPPIVQELPVQESPLLVQEPLPIMQKPLPVVQEPLPVMQEPLPVEKPIPVQETLPVVQESPSPLSFERNADTAHLEGILNAFDQHQEAEAHKVQEEKNWREAHGVLPSLVDFPEFPESPKRTTPESREQAKKRLAAELEINFPAPIESQKAHCHKVESMEDVAMNEDLPIEYVCNLCQVKFRSERAAAIHAATKKHLTNVAIDNGRTVLHNGKEGWRCSLCAYQSGSVDFLRNHLHVTHRETFGGQKPRTAALATDRVTRGTAKSSVSCDNSESGDTSPEDSRRRRSKREWTPSTISLQAIAASKESIATPILAPPSPKVPSKPKPGKLKKCDDAVDPREGNMQSRKQTIPPDKTLPRENPTPSGSTYFSALLDGLQKHLQNEVSPGMKVKQEAV